jgi:hypothetical protein
VHPVFHISKVKLFKGVSKKAELFGDDERAESADAAGVTERAERTRGFISLSPLAAALLATAAVHRGHSVPAEFSAEK